MYTPLQPPSDVKLLPGYLQSEFQRIAQAFTAPEDFVRLREMAVEPTKLFDGMVAYADGTNWNLDRTEGLKQSHLYTGEYWDQDSQLLYLRARWYDPKVGRFISADPFEGKQNDPRSLNRYAYAHSDPEHNADPSGEMTLMDSGMAQNIQSGLRSAMPTAGKNALEIARKAKIYDIYDYVTWPLHFYMYAERPSTRSGTRYDVGNRVGWGGVLKRNPFGIMPGGFVLASPVFNRQDIDGKGAKIVSLTFGQWVTWHASVVGTEQTSCKIDLPYSLTPGVGSNCLSWTIWGTAKAIATSRLPL